MAEPLVIAQGLGKAYRVYSSPWQRLLEAVSRSPRHKSFQALGGVDFQLERGEGLAVIGENGAGKSTLLKILAGITTPTEGRVEVRGKVASILELGSGFHPEFTGRQNIVLNAAMLGLSDEEVQERTPDIIAFSELGDFIDQPVKVYSTGMSMRLGFAIATQVDPEVLIIDEALSVGDGYFQKKCMDRLVQFLDQGGTLLFCSHAMYYVASFCRRALWLEGGRPRALGPSVEVIRQYEAFLSAKRQAETERPEDMAAGRPARLVSVEAGGGQGGEGKRARKGDPWSLEVAWETDDPSLEFHLAVGVDRIDDVQVVAFSTFHDERQPFTGRERYRVRLEVPELPFLQGQFSIQVYLLDERALHPYDQLKLRSALQVEHGEYVVGLIEVPHAWRPLGAEPPTDEPPVDEVRPAARLAAREGKP